MARELETGALLLRSVDYGEADKVCTFLTAERGKVSAFARGVRGSKKRFRGGLGAFVDLRITLRSRNPDSLPTLAESEAMASYAALGQDLARMSIGTHALELVDLALHDEQGAELYPTVLRFVRWLAGEERGPQYAEAGLHRLQLILLQNHGALPDFATCARSGRPLGEAERVWWLPEVGLVDGEARHRGEAAAELSAGALAYLIGMGHGHFPDGDPVRARTEVRHALRHVWRHLLGRDLKSWSFYDSLMAS